MSYIIKLEIAKALFVCGLILAAGSLFGKLPGLIAAGFVLVSSCILVFQLFDHHWRDRAKRGRKLSSYKKARKICDKNRPRDDRGVQFGKLRISTSQATQHFCIVGAVGSGKTLTIRMLMRDQLPLITKGSKRRAIIYDAKQDMVQIVYSVFDGKKPPCPIRVLNPFDQRCHAWDMAKDIDSPALAQELAKVLVPDSEEAQPFFTDAVRQLLFAVVTVFIRTRPGKWTFREVLLVMKSREKLRQVLMGHPGTRDVANNFLDSGEKTLGSIMATVATKLGPYEVIAAAWGHAKSTFSISKWLEGESILILGNDERLRSSLDIVNQLFVKIASQHGLSMAESSDAASGLTWFFFDEFREAGKLDGLDNIILRGRSKGCAVVLGFQDIQGVHHVYGEDRGNEIVGQCGNKAFLRIESPKTAEWASDSVGETEGYEYDPSMSESNQGVSQSVSARRQARSAVLPSEFMSMKVDARKDGLHGVYLVRSVGAFRAHYTPPELNEYLGKINSKLESFVSIPTDWQYIEPWSEEDDKNLGLQEPAGPQPKSGSASSKTKPKGPNLDDIGRMGG